MIGLFTTPTVLKFFGLFECSGVIHHIWWKLSQGQCDQGCTRMVYTTSMQIQSTSSFPRDHVCQRTKSIWAYASRLFILHFEEAVSPTLHPSVHKLQNPRMILSGSWCGYHGVALQKRQMKPRSQNYLQKPMLLFF